MRLLRNAKQAEQLGCCAAILLLAKGQEYSLWGLNPRPMAHKTIALATELRELGRWGCSFLLCAAACPPCASDIIWWNGGGFACNKGCFCSLKKWCKIPKSSGLPQTSAVVQYQNAVVEVPFPLKIHSWKLCSRCCLTCFCFWQTPLVAPLGWSFLAILGAYF